MNKIILLGGTGFLGKALSPLLQKEGFKIITMIHKNHSELSSDIFLGDISNPKILDSQLEDNDVIINLIGQYDQNLSQFIQKNILGAINILDSAIKKKTDVINQLNILEKSLIDHYNYHKRLLGNQ